MAYHTGYETARVGRWHFTRRPTCRQRPCPGRLRVNRAAPSVKTSALKLLGALSSYWPTLASTCMLRPARAYFKTK